MYIERKENIGGFLFMKDNRENQGLL